MTVLLAHFLLILLAVAIEFVAGSLAGIRNVRWSIDWLRFTERLCGERRWFRGWTAGALVLGIPVFGAYLMMALVDGLTGPFGYLLSLLVLLLMLGPEDFSAEVERHKRLLSGEAQTGAPSYLRSGHETDLGAPTGDEQFDNTRAELAAMAIAASRAWYGALFWFLIAGVPGVVAYRLTSNLTRVDNLETSIASALDNAREILDWIPARLTVLMMGLAGTLVPVIDTVTALEPFKFGASRRLIGQAVLAATDHGRIREVVGGDIHIYRINQIHALLQRVLVIWLLVIAAVALAVN